jgi:hypothetical protein
VVIADGTTACCTRGKLPEYDRPVQALRGVQTKLASTQNLLPERRQREAVRFALLHAKSAAEVGLEVDIDVLKAVGGSRTAARTGS